MTGFTPQIGVFVEQLDVAVEGHMDWTRRVLRCAVLRVSPGDDVLSPMAHTLCRFGCWFRENKVHFEALNEESTVKLEDAHRTMHDAIRTICEGVLSAQPGRSDCLDTFERTQAELVSLLAGFKTQLLASAERFDALTGLPLRHTLEHDFKDALNTCRRNKTRLYVVMMDVDYFKTVNDRYGHAIGDLVLCYFTDLLRSQVRSNEQLYRYGGDEFLALMQAVSLEAVTEAAQRFLQIVRDMRVPIPDSKPLSLTVTLGIARARDDEGLMAAVERADHALYEGKSGGRDCYVMVD